MDYFEPHELLCPHVFKRDDEGGLKFMDPRLREWLLWFRKTINRPVYINNYAWGGGMSQRGYRCNLCSLVADKTKTKVLYASAHMRFQALDFNVRDLTPEEVRQWIEVHKEEMPHGIRIENDTDTWVHVDVVNETNKKIIYFVTK